MPSPTVSIIIPTKNCRLELQRLLNSIQRQTWSTVEVLVIDNFSTDGTFELAIAEAKAFQKGPERNVQRSWGASMATGKYLMFFDADMELDPGLVEQCAELGEAGCDAVIIPERGGGEGYWARC